MQGRSVQENCSKNCAWDMCENYKQEGVEIKDFIRQINDLIKGVRLKT